MRLRFHHTLGIAQALLSLAIYTPLQAQAAFSAAHGTPSIQPWRYGFFSADFTEAKFGLTFMKPLQFGCSDEFINCAPNLLNFSVHTSAAARKGQQDLLSKVDFVPGFDVGAGTSLILTRANGSYDLFFIRGTLSSQERKVAITNPADSVTTIGETGQRTYSVAVGYNHAFSRLSVFGVAFEGRRELSSPGAQRPMEVCGPGSSQGGVNVLVCNDRYAGPLADLWAGQARVDANLPVARLGDSDTSVHLGVLAVGSVNFTEGSSAETNVALGPTLNLPEYPAQPVLSLIFGLINISDANLTQAQLNESFLNRHFLMRLAFSVPFRLMAGTS